jgi:hypothetical protein
MNENKNINPMHTFWIFGLGVGIGAWFYSNKFTNFIEGFLIGMFFWFIMIITIWPLLYGFGKWIIKKIG